MEESIPLEEVPEAKEQVKSEQTASTSPEDRVGTTSPTPECSICLGHLINTSFTDSCLHQFCFTCLLQWSKIKTECPLCKQTFKSIIHNVRSEEDYDQYHVPREMVQPPPVSPLVDINLELINLEYDFIRHVQDPVGRRFSFRTTMTPNRRFRLLPNPTHAQPVAEGVRPLSREELRYRRRNPSDYRRNVYRHGEWSAPLPGHYAGALERSAEFFRSNPYELNRLIPWINRDLQILLNGNEPHIAYVLRTIMDSLSRHDLRSAELRDVLRPHFGIHTDHFLHELVNYARTGFEMTAYDSFIRYPTHGLPSGYFNNVQSSTQSSSSSSSSSSSVTDDSDVRVVEQVDIAEVEIPAVGPHPIDIPGPSTVSQTFQLHIPTMAPTILTISSNSDESDCEVVGYVKPRHERTPEIIEIPSSDCEVPGPSTSQLDRISHSPPVLSSTSLDQPSTSQNSIRRHTRGVHRKISMHCSLNSIFGNSSSEEESADWAKKSRKIKRVKKTCKKSPRKQSQKRDTFNQKKRSRKISFSNDEDPYFDSKKKKNKRSHKLRPQPASQSNSENANDTSRSSRNTLIIQIKKNLINQNQNDRHTEDSSTSSASTYSTSSSSSDSDTSSSLDANLPLKKRRCERVRRKMNNSSDLTKTSKGQPKSTIVHCTSLDSTILRKDATKKEWYVDKKSSRSRSSSTSSAEIRHDTRLRIHEYRRNMTELFSVRETSINDQKHTNNQCSSRPEKIQDKHRSKHKNKHKEKERGKDVEKPSTSREKYFTDAKTRKRKEMHNKYKISKERRGTEKNKRHKRHCESRDSATSST